MGIRPPGACLAPLFSAALRSAGVTLYRGTYRARGRGRSWGAGWSIAHTKNEKPIEVSMRPSEKAELRRRPTCMSHLPFCSPAPPYPRQPPSTPSIRLRSFRTYLTVLRDTWVSFLRIARSFTQEFTRFSFREFREPQPPFDPLGPLERRGGIVPSRRFCAFDVTALILLTCGFLLFICLF